MTTIIVILLILALIFGGLGLFVEGLLWLLIIAAAFLVVSFVVGVLGRGGGRARV